MKNIKIIISLLVCFAFSLPLFSQVVNDFCADALPITCGETITGATVEATPLVSPPCLAETSPNQSPGVWYSFTGTDDLVVVSLCGSSFDTRLDVYASNTNCNDLICIAHDNDGCGLQSELSTYTSSDTTYYIHVYGWGTNTGDYSLSLGCITCDPPLNDVCTNPVNLDFFNTETGDLNCASQTLGLTESCPNSNANQVDLWYYTPITGSFVINFATGTGDGAISFAAYDAACGGNLIACGGEGYTEIPNPQSNGTWIQVFGVASDIGDFFEITIEEALYGCMDPNASNYESWATIDDGSCEYIATGDNCSNPSVITSSNQDLSISDLSDYNSDYLEACGGAYQGIDVVWEYSPTTDVCVQFLAVSSNDYMLSITSECPSSPNSNCIDSVSGGGSVPTQFIEANLSAGETYYITWNFVSDLLVNPSIDFSIISCDPVILGCTDPNALNYNPNATENDGSCLYSTTVMIPATGGTVLTTCNQDFYDNGGVDGDYQNNSNGYLTIYPDDPNSLVQLQGSYNVEANWDFISIYEGTDPATGTLIWTGTGEGVLPTITASAPNMPLTVQFTSDGTITRWGIEFVVTCVDAFIQGNVFFDANNDCIFNAGDVLLDDWLIAASNGISTQYGSSDANGYYTIPVTNGSYDVSIQLPNNLWLPCEANVNVDVNGQPITVDFPVQGLTNCPQMTVDISTPFLRRCMDNNYSIQYCNAGTALAEDAYIEVAFPDVLVPQFSSTPWTSVNDNVYTFNVGDVGVGECGTIQVTVYASCETSLGETFCVESHIYPDSVCTPVHPDWDGSWIQADIACEEDSIRFIIRNIGQGDMAAPLEYYIVEDEVMIRQGDFELNGLSETDIEILVATGGTFRIECMQAPNHPLNCIPSASLEGCGPTPHSLGFILQYPEHDNVPMVSIDCQEVIGSFDPNDKYAAPRGYNDNMHYITDSTDLEYRIRFQNTGTDTAFLVVLKDTLSEYLDPATIILGASSHPYEFDLSDRGIMTFRFDNIMLPDSNANEIESHGFVKFRIQQAENNPIGTVINNDASIYFDFNEPVVTNKTWHTIGEDFVTISTSVNQVYIPNVEVLTFPNPFDEYTIFNIKGQEFNTLEFYLYDTAGRLVRNEIQQGNQFKFYRQGLPSGIYFYTIEADGHRLNTGKVIVK